VQPETTGVAESVASHLADGMSVSLVGVRGSGRSTAVREVAARLDEADVAVVRVAGIAALRDRPFSAFSAAGWPLPQAGTAQATSALVETLSARLGTGRSAILIDDADELDLASLGVIAAARLTGEHPVLAVSRPAPQSGSALGTLAAQLQPGVRVAMPPLSLDQLHALLHELLPGVVDPVAVARIATVSGGLPRLVRALVHSARGTALVQDGHRWVSDGPLWNELLAHTVEPYLAGLDAELVHAVTELAVLGTVELALAERAVPLETIARLVELELVHVVAGASGSYLGVYPPLLADHLARHGPLASRAQAQAVLGSSAPAVAPAAALAFDVESGTMLSRRLTEHWQEQARSLRSRWEALPDADNAIELLLALHSASARAAEIGEVLARTEPGAGSPLARARLASWRALYEALDREEGDEAVAILAEARRALPGLSPLFDAVRAHLRFLLEEAPALDASSDAARASRGGASAGSASSADPAAELGAEGQLTVRAGSLLAAGRSRDALDLLLDAQLRNPTFRAQAETLQGLALLLEGRVRDGTGWALEHLQAAREALLPGPIQAHSYVAAFGLFLAGRFEALDTVLSAALTLPGVPVVHGLYRTGLITLGATAARWQGRASFAASLSEQAAQFGGRPGPFPEMIPAQARLLDRSADPELAAAELWGLAEDRMRRGYLANGVCAGVHSLAIHPDPARAAALAGAAQQAQSPLLRALGAYALAMGDRDEHGLAAAAAALSTAGADLLAAQAGLLRASVLLAAGRAPAAAEQAAASWRATEGFGRWRGGLFARLAAQVDLSPREREIAELLLRGLSTAEIAGALSLSTRTVENHMLSSYRKAGVDSRRALAGAAGSWLG